MTAQERVPKYYLVRTELEQILAKLTEGDTVPPERELAERFEVSRETVRQALHELLVEGRIERRGRGTVVSAPKLVQPLSLRSYTEGAQSQGRVPARLLVTWEDVPADAEMCADLEVPAGSEVMHLQRVLLADGARLGLESTYLPKPGSVLSQRRSIPARRCMRPSAMRVLSSGAPWNGSRPCCPPPKRHGYSKPPRPCPCC